MLEPVGAGVIAWVLLGESLTAVQVIGSATVLVGIVLAETARQEAAPAAVEEVEASPLPEGIAP